MKTILLFFVAVAIAASAVAQQTPTQTAQAEAIRLYPELATAGSPFNQRFLKAVDEARAANDPILSQPEWPLSLAKRVAEAPPQYVVAIQDHQNLRLSSGDGWTLETGEAFPLIRWVSASEFAGGVADPNDKTYALLQMDNKTLVVPSARIKLVDDSGVATAAMTYRQIVQQSREHGAVTQQRSVPQQPQQPQQPQVQQPTLEEMQQMVELAKKIQELRNLQQQETPGQQALDIQQQLDLIERLKAMKRRR